jgi:chromatin remodeling complex protein RSC6
MNLTDEIPRTEVTKRLTAYIKENDLQIEGNRKNFTVDQALSQVFNVPQGTMTNWFEMQKFLSGLLVTVKKKNTDDQTTTKVTGVNDENTLNTTTANERNANPPENTPSVATEFPKKKKIKRNA